MVTHKNTRYILLCAALILILCSANKSYCQLSQLYADTAKQYKSVRNYDSALVYYYKAKKSLSKDSIGTDYSAQIFYNIADICLFENNYDSAEIYFLHAKKIFENLHSVTGNAISVYDKLGQLSAITRDYNNAEIYYLSSKNIKQSVYTKESTQYAASCAFLANVYTATSQYDKAESLYLEAKEIREKLLPKDSAGYAQLCNNLANLYRETGKYEQAETLALLAKHIRANLAAGKDSAVMITAYAISCTNLANLYRDMGKYADAEALYIEAKNIRANINPVKESAVYASACNILADLYYFMNEYNKAEPLYIEAKTIREKIFGKENSDYAQSCNNLANLYRETGKYEAAEQLALEAKQIWDKLLQPDDENRADNFDNLGLIYKQTKKYKQAENAFLQAQDIWQKIAGTNNPSYATNAFYLGEVYWNLNEPAKANKYFTEAFNIQYNQMKKVFRFTNESEKELYLKNIKNPADEYLSFYFSEFNRSNASEPYSILLLNRNLTLAANEQLKQIISSSSDSSLQKKYIEWTDLKNQLGFLYLKNDTAVRKKITVLEDNVALLEKQLYKNATALQPGQLNNITWQSVQQSLKTNEAAIEFSEFNFYNGTEYTDSTYYIALLLRKNKPAPQLVLLFEKNQLAPLLNDVNNINDLYAANNSLYNIVWKPLEKYLGGINKIYFAPAGDLFKVSFAALPVNANNVLSDKYKLVQLNTTGSVTSKIENFITVSDKIVLYGGIDYTADTSTLKKIVTAYHSQNESAQLFPGDDIARGGSIQYLPATKTEVENIEHQATNLNIGVTVLTGINATEESFKALSGKASPAILHIATHGFFFPDPKENTLTDIQRKFEISGKTFRQSDNPLFRSGLLFAGANNAWQGNNITGIQDGIVTAYDVANMYLPNTKLVILSACETALGDIHGSEGVYGLQRAFKIAGVQNLVMSLWEVPDTEAAEFMQKFYFNMFNKQPVADAFYHAQTEMKNKYRNEPYKWAAWVLIK